MKRNFFLYLNDILEAIELIKRSTQDLTKKEFEEDKDIQDATIRRIELIGEAVKHLPPGLKQKYPYVQWKEIGGGGDVLIHAYFGVVLDKIWLAVKDDIPFLEKEIRKIIELERKKEN